jgi:polyphosphate kinase
MSEMAPQDASRTANLSLDDPSLYFNRELSWLAFNARVLEQASDPDWPLLERVKFLAIFASNLDEFFMIRVSGLHDRREAELATHGPENAPAVEELAKVRAAVNELSERAQTLLRALVAELETNGIRLKRYAALSERERRWTRDYFRKQVFPVLTPLAVDPLHPFPFVSNLSLSLAVEAEDPTTLERRVARVKVPESLERLLPVPSDERPRADEHAPLDFIWLEELIAENLADLFPGMKIVGCWPFRVTRDMDLEIMEEEAADLLALVDREVRRRRFGAAVRLEIVADVPERIRRLLLENLELDAGDVYETEGLLGLVNLFALAKLPAPKLHDAPLYQLLPLGWGGDPFARIASEELLLHHPYESFAPVLDLLRAAADDSNVLAIKMTLYRAGSDAEAVKALVRAAENGKQVAVSVELKARFDEENNIGWARALERAGAHVFYGASGLKTHAKALLVVRREAHGLRRYVHLSTGNYNASTARLYTDLGFFTTDELIGEDVSELFNALSGFSREVSYRKLAVAPHTLRPALVALIHREAERARRGEPSRIFAKLNALVDDAVIRELYLASRAGVPITLLVRGTCCLRPGVPGVSENVRVFSLLGRFLEHERVYVFGSGGSEEYYLSSADWMPRNLDRRVEILFPIVAPALRSRIRREVIEPFELDDNRVYELERDGRYERRRPAPGAVPVDAQVAAQEHVSEDRVVSTRGRVERLADLAQEELGRDRLLQERDLTLEQAVPEHGVVGVAGHVE